MTFVQTLYGDAEKYFHRKPDVLAHPVAMAM
jgi:hypothetical protein